MAPVPDFSWHCSFSFADAVACLVSQTGLPFSNILSDQRSEQIFRKLPTPFGKLYTSSIVLWAAEYNRVAVE